MRIATILFALFAVTLPAQESPGSLFRRDVDATIAALRRVEVEQHLPALGPDIVGTAQILLAMAKCHRTSQAVDGPVVRPWLDFLCAAQRDDGSFGDVASTAWAAAALVAIDPVHRGAAAERARETLPMDTPDPFAAMVAAVPIDGEKAAGAAAQAVCKNWLQVPGKAGRAEVAAALVQLVACQVATLPRVPVFSTSSQRGIDWLMQLQQAGRFSARGQPSLPLTGFGLMALQSKPAQARTAAERQAIEQGLAWLLATQNADGTWGDTLQNYTTCVAVGALARGGGEAARSALAKAQRAIRHFQNAEDTGYVPSDRDYGSIGYGGAQRGDLSNMHFALEALRTSGATADDEAFARALVFLQRTQNRRASNDFSGKVPDPERGPEMLDIVSGDDGGACYYPGNSSAGYTVQPDGKVVARSYGSMTYALLKAYALAGLPTGDPRMRAAVDWIQRNWILTENPGVDPSLGEKARYQGLFYYWLLMAQALDQCGIQRVVVGSGETRREIVWAEALRGHLEAEQRADGSWCNERNGRWMESEPLLCTCYALLALERCH
jgi:squalene-hopene/tetraprenyl-beta-curcumene cyclase